MPLFLAGAVLALAFYLASVPNNPLGFFIDESSIAYNAYTISQSGSDEYGVPGAENGFISQIPG